MIAWWCGTSFLCENLRSQLLAAMRCVREAPCGGVIVGGEQRACSIDRTQQTQPIVKVDPEKHCKQQAQREPGHARGAAFATPPTTIDRHSHAVSSSRCPALRLGCTDLCSATSHLPVRPSHLCRF